MDRFYIKIEKRLACVAVTDAGNIKEALENVLYGASETMLRLSMKFEELSATPVARCEEAGGTSWQPVGDKEVLKTGNETMNIMELNRRPESSVKPVFSIDPDFGPTRRPLMTEVLVRDGIIQEGETVGTVWTHGNINYSKEWEWENFDEFLARTHPFAIFGVGIRPAVLEFFRNSAPENRKGVTEGDWLSIPVYDLGQGMEISGVGHVSDFWFKEE